MPLVEMSFRRSTAQTTCPWALHLLIPQRECETLPEIHVNP